MILSEGRFLGVSCSKCGTPVQMLPGAGLKELRCGSCGSSLVVELFPSFFRGAERSGTGELVGSAEEASCFYHENKRATALCEMCGRFLCSLCEIRLGGRVLCPACVEKGKGDGSVDTLVNRRTLFDSMALSVSLLPLIFCYFATIITAPLAIYLAIRSWKAPGSILKRSRFRSILAILFSVLQLAGWVIFIYFLVHDAD